MQASTSLPVLKPLMLAGTASDVGKSIITAAFCRRFLLDGYHPAPFKAQNMSLNSYVTPEGGEIGRAQAMQAEAAGLSCHTDMNPVLLKPVGNSLSQLIVNGRSWGSRKARDYFNSGKEELFAEATLAFERLHSKFNPVVMEGAGSIAELNLKSKDIANLRMASYAKARVFLIGDIEKGGIFASLYGSVALLEPEERALIKGLIINKFRGDTSLFDKGRKKIEDLTGLPVLGVLPYLENLDLDEEDSVSISKKAKESRPGKVNVVIIKLDSLSNFTDFLSLEKDQRTHVYYTNDPNQVASGDVIVLPGSKDTLSDLEMLKKKGLDQTIKRAVSVGKTVIGICGGYQLMGLSIEDDLGMEGPPRFAQGLGILPVKTRLLPDKLTRQRQFKYRGDSLLCSGYEIHCGETLIVGEPLPLNKFIDGAEEGYLLNERCWGTYLHGILDNSHIVDDLLKPYTEEPSAGFDLKEHKEQSYDRLAEWLRENLDMDSVYKTLL